MPARKAPLARAPLTSGPGIPVGRRRPLPPPKPKALPKVSPRRLILNRQLAKVVAAKRETVTRCEAEPLLRALVVRTTDAADLVTLGAALARCRPDRPERPHHTLKRSRAGAFNLTDSARLKMICPSCDSFTEAEVRLSTLAGLLIPSWEA